MSGLALCHLHDDLEAVAVALARRVHRAARVWVVSGVPDATPVLAALTGPEPLVGVPAAEVPARVSAAGSAPDPVAATREIVATGDVVVLVGGSADAKLCDLARRTRAWGACSLWLTTDGRRPPVGTVDHLIVSHGSVAAEACAGQLAQRTAQLLAEAGPMIVAAELDDGEVCVTCADEGLIAEVAEVDAATGDVTAWVEGRLAEIDTTLLGPVAPHELVLVHAGMALQRLAQPADHAAGPCRDSSDRVASDPAAPDPAVPDPAVPDPVRSWT